MKEFKKKKFILWDFDGVILDSMEVREQGFWKVLQEYPQSQVEELIQYHKKNGGLSRYVKFEYFLKEIRGEKFTDEDVQRLSEEFSVIMRKLLTTKERLIPEVVEFISTNYLQYQMHIVSGSDGDELRFLCAQLEISRFFKSINGSPTPKTDLVKNLLVKEKCIKEETCLIGDSINDYDAAYYNGIDFYGYNNIALKQTGLNYINSFH